MVSSIRSLPSKLEEGDNVQTKDGDIYEVVEINKEERWLRLAELQFSSKNNCDYKLLNTEKFTFTEFKRMDFRKCSFPYGIMFSKDNLNNGDIVETDLSWLGCAEVIGFSGEKVIVKDKYGMKWKVSNIEIRNVVNPVTV